MRVIIDQFELECVHCHGTGTVAGYIDDSSGRMMAVPEACDACGGKGTRTETITEDFDDAT